MKASWLTSVIILMIGIPGVACAGDAVPIAESFAQPEADMTAIEDDLFRAGRALFAQPWVVGPSIDHPDVVGLGPLYNRLSCIACHVKNGGGGAPEDGMALRAAIVRLSSPGKDAHGAPLPHPVYGGQLNPQGVPGVDGEGKAILRFEDNVVTLADGETVTLRRPTLNIEKLAYGPIGEEVLTSVRNAPPVFGLGLLEKVPEEQLRKIAEENGGRLNTVWDAGSRRFAAGRFGLKANQPSLKQQIANAFVEDIGITSSLFRGETCPPVQTVCNGLINKKAVELSPFQLASVTEYVAKLAVPPRRNQSTTEVAAGEGIFRDIGCASCHRESLTTAAGTEIHPYSDLLLHDMGPELADGRPDYKAGPQDWRTPPLWGLGLAPQVNNETSYLHDGRARTPEEAILWHGGEAHDARERYSQLPGADRAKLKAFLNSL